MAEKRRPPRRTARLTSKGYIRQRVAEQAQSQVEPGVIPALEAALEDHFGELVQSAIARRDREVLDRASQGLRLRPSPRLGVRHVAPALRKDQETPGVLELVAEASKAREVRSFEDAREVA